MTNNEIIKEALSKMEEKVKKITLDWDDKVVGAGITVQEIEGGFGRFQGETVKEACEKAIQQYGAKGG